jgi:hypothetical protein
VADEDEEVEELPDLPQPPRWGLAVIGLSLAARVTEHASGMMEDLAKFWCELAMAAAGQSNHESRQRDFARDAAIEIETLVNGAQNASSGDPGGD